MDDKDTKDAYHEAMRDKQLLAHKTKKMGTGEADSSSEDSEGESDDSDESEEDLRAKATDRINREVNSSESEESDGEESAEANEFIMDFGKDNKAPKKAKKSDTGNAIMNLKFMQNAEQRKKEMLRNQVSHTVG